ncbi:uncharacterized protein LAJ45_06889 [Morchella importuna]|uniref:AA9 family lytic polysaccharide monooxygenase n=1 Tax=Morchella conica CCBAS932 TaxID=1392247 RepID=A0A3N4K9L4_9PEZI|nr:uncharacterized protein LAJ45_06889 [Morchella importuna]KAH8148915.1 hypothetical protein LAJ45_06889 [Morchella importuna]RPB07143.1 hypothetical protein P167DRAFT_568782 [Morchella conica CCBAS932]
MKFSALTLAVLVAAFSDVASAHYRFAWLTAGGVKGAEYENIRPNTNYNSPVTDTTSTDIRCNVGATGSATTIKTVAAGSTVTFDLDQAVYHQGPILWYLGKVPSGQTAATWDGSGANWIKIKQEGPTFSSGSATWPMYQTYSASIPSSIPSGDYLLRVEQIALHNPGGAPQFYISCGQITVTGGGSASPSYFSIPGHITATDPGITVNIYNAFTSYTFPGPAVFSG